MKLLCKIRALWQRGKIDADMSAEIQAHLELQARENEKSGMSAEEARQAARRQFGGVEQIKERAREQRALGWVQDFARDGRFALRMIGRSPVMSAVIVLSLALGLGANTAVFSWIHTVALEPLPGVSDGRQLVVVEQRNGSGLVAFASPAEWHDVRAQTTAFSDLMAHNMNTFSFDEAGEVVNVWGQFVTENFFSVLGVQPAAGRWPTLEESRPGGAPVLVISHRLWQAQFGGRSDTVGRAIRLRDLDFTIVGIAPPEFQGGVTALALDLWLPQGALWKQDARQLRAFQLLGRLKPGVSLGEANADVALTLQRLAEKYPDTNRGITAEVLPLWRSRVGAQAIILPTLATLQTVMILLLLVVCTNTANLLLAQATTRTKEIAIRLALGAGRSRIVRQLLAEGLLLSLAGAALGTVLAFVALDMINAIPKPPGMPVSIIARLEWSELGYSLVLAVVCTLGFALVPALQSTKANVGEALKAGGRTSGGTGRRRFQEVLVGAEIALTLMIVIMAGLFVKSFQNARLMNPGFEPKNVVLGVVDLAAHGYDERRARVLAESVLSRAREMPGVEAAAFATWVPLDLRPMRPTDFTLVGREQRANAPEYTLWCEVTRGYFETMRIDLTEGRDFSAVTEKPGEAEVVVNEEFRHRYIGEGEAIGRRLAVNGQDYRVVGVVRGGKYSTLNETSQPMVYLSINGKNRYLTLYVRTTAETTVVLAGLRRMVRDLDAGLPLFDQRTLTQHVAGAMILRVIPAKILAVLGPLALYLAVTGLYSVLAYAVAQRTHEIGVRMTLGATAGSVIRLILRQGLVAVVGGLVVGWGAAYALSTRLSSELVGVPAGDPALFYTLPVILAAVAVFACWLPARRAAKVDPMVALRAE